MEWAEITRDGAYHEAAHAVHAISEGWEVPYVSVSTEERFWRSDVCAIRRPAWTEIVPSEAAVNLLAADRSAWWAYHGEPMPEQPFEKFVRESEYLLEVGDAESDDAKVLVYLRRLAELEFSNKSSRWGDPAETYRALCESAERFVRNHWAEIEMVAWALIEHGCLDGGEVVRIVEAASEIRHRDPEDARETCRSFSHPNGGCPETGGKQ